MIQDIREYIASVERDRPGDVLRIKEPVDPKYEITAHILELEKRRMYPILFFENVKGYDIPIVGNLFPTPDRVAYTLNTTKDKLFGEWLRREKEPLKPRLVSSGRVQDVVLVGDEVDCNMLPIPTHFEQDGGTAVTVKWSPLDADDTERATFAGGQSGMQQGWTGTMDQLAAYLAKERQS